MRLTDEQMERVDEVAALVRHGHSLMCPAGGGGVVLACTCSLAEVIPGLCEALIRERHAGRVEQLTADDRRGLAAVFGYDLGREDGTSEAAIELTNVRKLLVDLGVPEADRQGVWRPTVAMLEDALPKP